MSLVELWRNSRDQFDNKQVSQIIGFAGDGTLRNNGPASTEFRALLREIPSDLLGEYGQSCLERPFTNSGFALQDIVNEVGRRLGFSVEHGLYQGTRSDIGFDGLWKFPGGHHVVVEVKTTDAYRIDTTTIADYRRRLVEEDRISEEASSILFIVGRQDTGDLEAQIRGSRYAWDIRLISLDALLKLLSIREQVDDPQIVERICEILIPKEFTRLDHIIDIVFYTAEDAKDETAAPISETLTEQETSTRQPFTRNAEAVAFNDACARRAGEIKGVSLVRKTKTTYQSESGNLRLVSLVSRDYDASPSSGSFWYGLRDYQKEFMDSGTEGYLIFGCGTPEEMLLVPADEVNSWSGKMNTSVKDSNGVEHWHLHLYRDGITYYLEPKQGFDRIDLTRFRV